MRVLHPTDSEPKTQYSSVPNSKLAAGSTRDLGTEHCSAFEIVSEKVGGGTVSNSSSAPDRHRHLIVRFPVNTNYAPGDAALRNPNSGLEPTGLRIGAEGERLG
jgi:hypothetical protein